MTTTQVKLGGKTPPVATSATPNVGGGTFAAATYFWKITFTGNYGETNGSNEITCAVALNGTATLLWTPAPAGTQAVKIYRGTVTNTENVLIATIPAGGGTYTDTGTAGSAATPPAAAYAS